MASGGPESGGSPTPAPRSALAEMLAIAAPTVVAMTSYTVMQSVDKLMASRLGPDPIYVGAQGNGGLAAWVPISVAMGLIHIVNTYVSQNLGAGRAERGPAYAWNALWVSAAWWLVLLPYAWALPRLFEFLWSDPGAPDPRLAERVAMSVSYGRPLIYGAIITMAARAFAQYFYGMHRAGVVLVASLAGNVTNFACNSVLMYGPVAPATGVPAFDAWFDAAASIAGALGIPAMGISGAAYGTLIGTAVELLIPLAVFLGPSMHARYATRTSWRPSRSHVRDILRLGWPGSLMFGNEMICWGLFMVHFVGKFGAHHANAGWIAHQWMSLSFMPTVGISIATTATVGKCMGMRRPDLAAKRAWLGMGLAMAWMTTLAVVFVVFRRELVELFIDGRTDGALREKVIAVGMGFMIATAAFQFFDAIAMTLSGALRGAGDTVFTGVSTVALSWGLIVGGSVVATRYFPELSSLGPWIAAAAYIIVLSLVILGRFLSGRWRDIKVVKDGDARGESIAAAESAVTDGL